MIASTGTMHYRLNVGLTRVSQLGRIVNVLQRTPKQIERDVKRLAARMIKNLNKAVAETSRIMAELDEKKANGGPMRRKAKQAKSKSAAGS
jgi:hypothetical protein